MNTKICNCCGKDKKLTEYYASHSLFNKATGKVNTCKNCILEYVEPKDNSKYSLDKVKDTLRMLDKPFVVSLWEASTVESEERGTSCFRMYMKNIGMKDFRVLSWDDSTFGESDVKVQSVNNANKVVEDFNDKDDKSYNQKWMGEYSPSELDYLENYLNGLHKDFKIVTENHKDYAKKIAKASLHMDNCFRDVLEGVSGADKRYKDAKDVFDTLSKSAQFSESQRGQNEVGLGCFGRVFEMVENKTFIPEHIPLEKDDIDKILDDFSHILKSV